MRTAIEFARRTKRPLHVVAVVEQGVPELELLHAHLKVAAKMADAASIYCTTEAVRGHVAQVISDRAQALSPWLVVMGRTGLDSEPDTPDVGPNVERVLRKVSSNVLVVARSAAANEAQAAE